MSKKKKKVLNICNFLLKNSKKENDESNLTIKSYDEQILSVFDSIIKQKTHSFEEAPSKKLFIGYSFCLFIIFLNKKMIFIKFSQLEPRNKFR